MINSYRREYWNQQPVRVELWSEKGTVRGLLRPVLDELGVGFRLVHGFCSSTIVHDVAEDDDGRPLIVIYVGDYDPSGMYMSVMDLPARFERYDGGHVAIKRIALVQDQLADLPCFPASDKGPKGNAATRTRGSSRTTVIAAGSWTRSIPTSCVTASAKKSRHISIRCVGALQGGRARRAAVLALGHAELESRKAARLGARMKTIIYGVAMLVWG